MSNPTVLIETPMGEMLVELWPDKAPETVANFLAYVDEEFYDGLIFHRVIKNFMIQGGGMDMMMREKKNKAPIKNEARADTPNEAYTLAMARTMDPHSATSQFFINVKDNDFLNFTAPTAQGYGYAVFGKVTEGQDVAMKLSTVRTKNYLGHSDVPSDPITIISIRRFEV
ncbi:MAG TPA: peptidylprolyl isomerase [Humidesulfovibrio sp.]|uniref:peptidylprolyl isomerase n=1 Tax=Humidesulfovibrio sp. TaxID=2910988 RepID=UPI002B913279|nr:peptidylprolyl isomerase [Humidesulfovibrio sp.]HWR02997.1 peptidylprolyl isomerase [Humidesulfovibrio sp.]